MIKNLEISVLLDYYGEMLTQKQRELVDYYYNKDLSLSEISENEGITRQGVRDCIKRAENTLFDIERNLGLVKRFEKIKSNLHSISEHADKIKDLSSDMPDISSCIFKILQSVSEINSFI